MTREEEYYPRGWHLDKRVSVGHIVTTVLLFLMFTGWMIRMENRVTVTETNQLNIQRDDIEMRQMLSVQYAEILRRLERMDDKIENHRDKQKESFLVKEKNNLMSKT